MTGSIDVFPQHQAGKHKPTVAEIVTDGLKTGQSEDAIIALLGRFYPEMPLADLMAVITGEIERLTPEAVKNQIELDRFKEIFALIESIRAELGDEDMASDQALWIAAERGNEQAIAFWYSLEAAVALDPDWSVSEEGHAVCREGATYDSPEKLVAAYRAGWIDDPRPVEDVVGKICLQAFRSHGVTLDNIDHVDDTTHQAVNELNIRIARVHPRRAEIQHFFAEKLANEEIRQQCQERGIPLIED
jgi:hypothetical protein